MNQFKAGDWVRRKKAWQGSSGWPFGDEARQILSWDDDEGRPYIQVHGVNGSWDLKYFDLVDPPFDPHALGMALKLSKLLRKHFKANYERRGMVSDWLRDEAMEELLSQETPRGGE